MLKKAFLLPEVLIAIVILTMCFLPLVKTPILSYQNQIANLKAMEAEVLADWAFSEIKGKLLRHEIRWEDLPGPGKKTRRFSLPPVTLSIPGIPPSTIKRTFFITCNPKSEKTNARGDICRLLGVYIRLDPWLADPLRPKGYYYNFVVQKVVVDGKQDSGHIQK